MTEQQVKIYISKYVLPQLSGANENVLRHTIFSLAKINWQEVGEILYKEHPELNNPEYYNSLDLTSR